MTKLLEKVVRKASKLDADEQDAFAQVMWEELASEERWARQFRASKKKLAALVEEAREDVRQGRAVPLDEIF